MTTPRQTGELVIFGRPTARLDRALDVLGARLHPTLDRETGPTPGASRHRCVWTALVVRDALNAAGVPAEAAACTLKIRHDGAPARELVVGDPDDPPRPGGWPGHLVVLADGWLVDPTLGQARRDWCASLPEMAAAPRLEGSRFLSALESPADALRLAWTPRPDLDWSHAPDAAPDRRDEPARELARLILTS